MKRSLETETERETNFFDLPSEIKGYIILMSINYRIRNVYEWNSISLLSKDYPSLAPVMTRHVLPQICFIDPEVFQCLPFVVLRALNHLTEMTLLRREETGTILPQMNHVKNLTLGTFHHDDHFTFSCSSLTQLETLVADFRLEDKEIIHLTNLTNLNLDENYQLSAASITKLTNITSLSMNDPKAIPYGRKFEGTVLEKLPKLQSLSFKHNYRIRDLHMTSLTNLTKLDISGACYCGTNMTDDGLSHLVSLVELNISNVDAGISDIGLFPLQNLTNLNIKNNRHLTAACLERLTNLRELNVTRIRRQVFTGIRNLTNLTSLVARSVTGVPFDSLENLSNLTHLDLSLSYTTFTDRSIQNLINLKHLNIYENFHISPSGVKMMKHLMFVEISNFHFNKQWVDYLSTPFELIIVPFDEKRDRKEDFNYDID